MKIAIKGHLTKGKEVIQILESLGGVNSCNYVGNNYCCYYEIHGNTIVCTCTKSDNYKYYTLEEFEKEFPFKIGDKIMDCSNNEVGTITDLIYIDTGFFYNVDFINSGQAFMPLEQLKPYKEMKKERNITLTLDKAKEWYLKGGELKEVALQAYSEEELTKVELPKTWEEFCKEYPVKAGECWIGAQSFINICKTDLNKRGCRNWMPSKKSAEAHLAMIQLEQLRDCWRQGWEPDLNPSYCIKKHKTFGLGVYEYCTSEFLSFKNRKTAEEFLKCFKDLIEKAGDLI